MEIEWNFSRAASIYCQVLCLPVLGFYCPICHSWVPRSWPAVSTGANTVLRRGIFYYTLSHFASLLSGGGYLGLGPGGSERGYKP